MKVQDDPRFPLDPNPSKDWLDQFLRQLTRLWRDLATQVNDASEGKLQGAYNALTAAPTTGTYKQGDFIRNSAPSEAGSVGSKYIIFGWQCVASGTPGTWKECRFLTGN